MAPTDSTDRITFWQDHVTAWQVSDLTQKAYCEAHGLRYATFGYWVRKLRTPSGDHQESASGFIPVTLAASHGERSEGW
ncbi:IS66 family insertion sequence element accessory protein TnpA [Thiolapillus sp.]|uniref:IS66 family insertion sequence element accessory protein TnpA n=1 Tax=Thiolapillus sp. TaxID=2017437 RepID=UPI003AF6AA06